MNSLGRKASALLACALLGACSTYAATGGTSLADCEASNPDMAKAVIGTPRWELEHTFDLPDGERRSGDATIYVYRYVIKPPSLGRVSSMRRSARSPSASPSRS